MTTTTLFLGIRIRRPGHCHGPARLAWPASRAEPTSGGGGRSTTWRCPRAVAPRLHQRRRPARTSGVGDTRLFDRRVHRFRLLPAAFIPAEDQGYLFVNVQLPNAASVERTQDVLRQVVTAARRTPGIAISILLARLDLNIYVQIGLVLLVGLAAKNAILIVECAKQQRDRGLGIIEAAIDVLSCGSEQRGTKLSHLC